jgi:hypothetical protein
LDTKWNFESFAISRETGKVYGGVAWGFDVDGEGKLTSHTPWFVNGPTPEFKAAVAAYNKQCEGPAEKQTAPPQTPLGPFY